MLKKIKVYGVLRKYTGQSEFMADVSSPHQAFSFLFCNFKGLEEKMANQLYCVQVGDKKITQDSINIQTDQDIKIIPIVHGNIIGTLIYFGVKYVVKKYVAQKILQYVITYVVTDLLLRGVNDLLGRNQDNQNQQSKQDPLDPAALQSNYSFTGLTNISQSGIPVNVAYGEILVGSIVVSNGIDTVQVRGTN
tara:strand:- start:227 stop:802 length:576 start_codon:yes stop_codon:yes gene_type:complete